jgi:hypothetical protein
VDDGEPSDEQWRVPPGAPIRLSDWAALPIVYLAVGVIDFAVQWGRLMAAPTWWVAASLTYATAVLASSVALAACGYRANRSLTARSVTQFRIAAIVPTVLVGVLLSGTPFVGAFLLAVAGYQLANVNVHIVNRAQPAWTDSLWQQIVIVAVVLTLVALLAQPLITAVGYLPLIVIDAVMILLCPVIAGFAYQSRKLHMEHSH